MLGMDLAEEAAAAHLADRLVATPAGRMDPVVATDPVAPTVDRVVTMHLVSVHQVSNTLAHCVDCTTAFTIA